MSGALRQNVGSASDACRVDPCTAILSWTAAALQLAEPIDPAQVEANQWPEILKLLDHHRLAGLAWPALEAHRPALPAKVVGHISRFREITSRMNGANLLTMRRIMPALESAGIKALACKGPILQQAAYGAMFVRPSSDVDLLVTPSDFRRAGKALEELGYRLADECRSVWWQAGLGERHYLGIGAASATVDLHHRLQQPGCPFPRKPNAFLAKRRSLMIGGQPAATLSPAHTILLAAMSYAKALQHREPAARYAIDVAALTQRLDQGEWHSTLEQAADQGLTNTLCLALRGARLLLGPEAAPVPPGAALGEVSDALLFDMTLQPDQPGLDWPRRRRFLHGLLDRKRDYPKSLGAMLGAEALRRATTRHPSASRVIIAS